MGTQEKIRMLTYQERVDNILTYTGERCTLFFIDKDDDYSFKHKLFYPRKLKSFWDYELEMILTNIENFNELPYKSLRNILTIKKELK